MPPPSYSNGDPGRLPELKGGGRAGQNGPIRLSCNEIRKLLARTLLRPLDNLAHILAWSHFRRHHQARAKISHWRRRGYPHHLQVPL
ncbi:hypothetical protein GCM10009647_082390 [Streptomyces sanglieri]